MKNRLLKVIPALLIGVSLTSCTILSDLGIGGKSDITKFAKNKKEVSLTEFVDKMKNSVKDTDYVKESYQLPDSTLLAGVKLEASQKLRSPSYSNQVRNEASLKLSATLDAAYDKDNESIKAGFEGSYNYSEKNATLGEASAKYESKLNAYFMPNGSSSYVIADTKNKTVYDIPVGEGFNLNQTLSFGMNRVMNLLSNMNISQEFNEAEFNQTLSQYGLSLRYYDDSNVMTVVGNWDYSFDVGNKRTTYWSEYNPETGTYEEHVDVVEDYWGRAHVSATVKFQFKVVKVVKLRALFDGALEVEYIKNHAATYNEFYPLGISGLAGDCEVGDIEEIKAKVEAGINLEHEKVNNKLPSISGYKNITPRYSELDS